jgi:hypothetical protein
MKLSQKGFSLFELLIILATIFIILFVGDFLLRSQTHNSPPGSIPQPNVIGLANGIGATLYKPTSLPPNYVWYGIDVQTANSDPADKSINTSELGKFTPVGQSYLHLDYINTHNYTQPGSIFNIDETKYLHNFDPHSDCVTPVSINSTYECSEINSKSGQPIYYNSQMNIAFYITGNTFIYIYGDEITITEMVNTLNALLAVSVDNLGLLHPENIPIEQQEAKHFPTPISPF